VTALKPVPREQALKRREYLINDHSHRIHNADAIVITRGLAEAWHDPADGKHLNAAPGYWIVKRTPERFEAVILGYARNRDALRTIIEILAGAKRLPGVRVRALDAGWACGR
jgi:hypothetical protein